MSFQMKNGEHVRPVVLVIFCLDVAHAAKYLSERLMYNWKGGSRCDDTWSEIVICNTVSHVRNMSNLMMSFT